jgi:hypothetical protein
MLSMMQLSQSVLHAVGDINSHNRRLHGLAARAPGRCERRAAVRAARKKRRHAVCFPSHLPGGEGRGLTVLL